MKKKKILYVIYSMDMGGIETLLINIIKKIDKNKFSINFLLWKKENSYFENDIIKNSANIYKLRLGKNPIIDFFRLLKFFDSNRFDVVHVNSHFYSCIFVLTAFLKHVPIRITHFHSFSDNKKKNIIRNIYIFICRSIINIFSTHKFACSIEAARYGFGKKYKNAIIIKNSINVENYINYNINIVNSIKKDLNIGKNDLVLGTVGRQTNEKNQMYILHIVNILVNNMKIKNIKCILVGNGTNNIKLKEETKKLNLTKHIIFVGEKNNINDYLHCFDIFLFPSIYEGFGLALLEAQAAGIYSIASDSIPKITDMNLNLVKYLSLENIDLWVNEIIKYNKVEIKNDIIKRKIIENGFDISNTVNELSLIYNGGSINE